MMTLRLIGLACMIFLVSCVEKKNELTIPDSLSQNEKVRAYFENLDQFIDEYVTMIEELAESSKENSTSDFGSAMQTFSTVASSTLKMAPLLEKMQQLETEGEILKNELTQEELSAFIDTYTKLIARIQAASLKINN